MKRFTAALIASVALITLAPLSALADQWGEPITTPDRFVVLASYNNLAVYDKETGLVWEQSPSTTLQTWQKAQISCNQKTVGNRKGWQLPTIQELASLVDPTRFGPALPAGHPFSNVQSSNYWSATSFATSSTIAWFVDVARFSVCGGNCPAEALPKSDTLYVWCVRGGQGPDAQ